MKRIEKIEVRKNSGVFMYTGEIKEYDKDNVQINTIKGEELIFRKEQIEGRRKLTAEELKRTEEEMKRHDKGDKDIQD